MNINNLEVGHTFKNYKALCEALGEKVKGGKSKELQVKDWERYFEYTKKGHSFTISKILDTPLEKINGRVGGDNAVSYIDLIEHLILDLLANQKSEHVFISKNNLLKALKMVNSNYSDNKFKLNRLSKEMGISIVEIKDFYTTSDSVLQSNVETALKRLDNKALIIWNKAVTVGYLRVDIDASKVEKIDEYGDTSFEFHVGDPSKETVHRKATPDERVKISRAEKDVLRTMGYEKKHDLFMSGKREEYYRKVTDLLFKRWNIYLYYTSYEITFNKDYVKEESDKVEHILSSYFKMLTQKDLNCGVMERLSSNAENRNRNASDKFQDTNKEKYKYRMSFEYLTNFNTLLEKLVKVEEDVVV